MRLFPDDFGAGHERTRKVWDLDWPLPIPRSPLTCPICHIGELAVKDWKFHNRSSVGSKSPWRCDVRLKCMTCGCVHIAGVLVPKSMFDANQNRRGAQATTWLHWREGKRILSEAGFFERKAS